MSVAERPLRALLLRAAVCALVTAGLYATLGWPFALLSLVGWGFLLAEPLYEVAASGARRTRHQALHDATGLHFEHAGYPIRVLETEHERWLRASQLQAALGGDRPEEVFARRFGGEAQRFDGEPGWYLRDEAVADYLGRSNVAMDARRNGLRLFVQREVIDPHRRAKPRRR